MEFLNIAQDDALTWPKPTHRTYPSTVNARMGTTIIPFVRKSIDVNMTMLAILEVQLGLPRGELLRLHSLDGPSGGEARCIKTPPNQSTAGVGAHTDFGTLVSPSFVCCGVRLVSSRSRHLEDVPTQPLRRLAGHATRVTKVAIHQGQCHRHWVCHALTSMSTASARTCSLQHWRCALDLQRRHPALRPPPRNVSSLCK